MEIIKGAIITILILLFVLIIIESMTKNITEKLIKQQEVNNKVLSLLQNEQDKIDTLLRIIYSIRTQLSLLNSKDSSKEEKKKILNEIIAIINEIERINSEITDGLCK